MNYQSNNTSQTFTRLLVYSELSIKAKGKDLGKYGLKKHVMRKLKRTYYVFTGTYQMFREISNVA